MLKGGWVKTTVSNFYASAQCSMARGILFLSCSLVCASVCALRNIVNTTSCRVFDAFSPNLHQLCIMGQEMNATFGVKRSTSRWNKVCWKQQFLGLLTLVLFKFTRPGTSSLSARNQCQWCKWIRIMPISLWIVVAVKTQNICISATKLIHDNRSEITYLRVLILPSS